MPDLGVSGDRTRLAWSRSALNLAANGVLIARAAAEARLIAIAIALAAAVAGAAMLVWRHGDSLAPARRRPAPGCHHQELALLQLSALTVSIAIVAGVIAVL